jgi:drug/metabolite transporter (DMT)-like permease
MSQSSRPLDSVGVALALMLCISWGAQQPAAKLALADIGPATQGALRSVFAIGIVFGWNRWRGVDLSLRDGSFWPGIVAGLMFSSQFLFLYFALSLTDAARVIVFIQSAPFFVAIASPLLLRDGRLGGRGWAGVIIAFAGVLLALQPWNSKRDASLLGDLFGLLGGLSWGITTVYIKGTRLRSTAPGKLLLYQLAVSILVLGLGALLMGEHTAWPWRAATWGAFLFQVVWIVPVTMSIWYWLISRYPAAQISAFTFLTPVFGLAVSHFLLGEDLPSAFLAACVLVIVGLILVTAPRSAVR